MTIEDGEIVHVYLRYLVKQGRGVITVRLTQQCQKNRPYPIPLANGQELTGAHGAESGGCASGAAIC